MNLQKKKCHKGSQHTGRSIQALCLEPNCTNDRLLCFYCIHESHHNHSIAYLISGLKSPLELLNKNSHCQNPEKNFKYIENRFKKLNKGWLKISDNLESVITQIEEKMTPQFNVISETFKKNSVDQIIQELTSNEITSDRIEEYVGMINMVKKYKFNDVEKLKFMAFIIEKKLSSIFVNANHKISDAMNQVIEETNEMNFLNFNLQKIMKDRSLYLDITKNLSLCKINDLQINSLNYELLCGEKTSEVLEIYEIQSNQIGEEGKEIEEIINGTNQGSSLVIMEGVPIEEQLKQVFMDAEKPETQELGQSNPQNQNFQQQFVSNNEMIDEKNEQKDEQEPNHQRSVDEQDQKSQSESHSNGFRSYKRALEAQQAHNSEFTKLKENLDANKIQYEEGEIQSNEEENRRSQHNTDQNDQQSEEILSNQQSKHEPIQNPYPELNEENLDSEQQFKEAYGVEANYQQPNSQAYQEILGDIQKKQEPENHREQASHEQIVIKIIEEKDEIVLRSAQETENQIYKEIPNPNNSQQNLKHSQQDKALSEFSCQFPSINGNYDQELINSEGQGSQQNEDQLACQHQKFDENFMPSYHFSLSINNSQMTLSNTYNLTKTQKNHQQSEETQDPIFLQNFYETTLFDEFLEQNNEGQKDSKTSKNFDMLKKYFVFYNGENSQQSSEELGTVPPKRVKWIQDQKKQPKQKSQEKPAKKKIKLPESLEPLANDMDFMDYPRTRTRSERMKLAKILEIPSPQINNQSKQAPKNVQKKCQNKSGQKQEEQNDEMSQEESNKSDSQSNKDQKEKVIQEAFEQQEQSEENLKTKINDKNDSDQQQSNSNESSVPNQSQKDSEDENNEESDRRIESSNKRLISHPKLKTNNRKVPFIQKFNKEQPQRSHEPQNPRSLNLASTYPSSLKLDKHALAQVSHSLLHKYEKEFIKQQKYRKQTDEEDDENKMRIKCVHLNGRFHEEIKKRLSLLDEDYIEELTIYCDTMDCAINEESVALICKMTKLTKLCVYWTYRLPKTLTKKLISSLPLLEQLVLCELQDLDTEIANQIVSKLPNLKRFHYASDYMKNLDKMEQNLQFLIDFVGTSTKLAPLFILSKLKNIETFWASDIDDIKQVKQILTKMKSLKQVSISAFQKRNKDLNSIFAVLSKRNTLICLSLQGLQFKEDSLVSIIRNNPNLNTLIINECPTVSNNTLAAVADTCLNLEQLFLMLTDSLEGERIFELKNLRTLVVRACWSINVNKFRQGIKKLKNLKYLSLNMNNYWLNDEMLPSLSVLPNLVFLNLDTTKVTDKGMQHLANLKNLNTLICGRTQITSAGLYKFLEKSKSQIKKLGLSRESNEQLNRPQKINKHDVIYTEFQGKFLVRIGELLPELTHLSIGGFKNLYIENFATLDNLKCLEYKMESLPEETQKFLETTRLNLNANY